MRQRRIRKQAVRHQPTARAALSARHVVLDNTEVIDGNVGELGATRAFTDRPYVRRRRLQRIIHANVTALVDLDAGFLEPDPSCVRDAPGSDHYIAGFDGVLTASR